MPSSNKSAAKGIPLYGLSRVPFLRWRVRPQSEQEEKGDAGEDYIDFDVINSTTELSLDAAMDREMQAKDGAPWTVTLDDPEAFLVRRGWQATLTQIDKSEANYGRCLIPSSPAWFLICRVRG